MTGWASAEYQKFDPTSRDERIGMLVLGDSFLAGSALQGLEQRFPIVLQRMIPDQLHPHHTGDCSLIDHPECLTTVDRFRFEELKEVGGN